MSPEADSYIAFVARASLCGDSAEVTCRDGVLRIVFSFVPPWWDIPARLSRAHALQQIRKILPKTYGLLTEARA